MPHTTTFGALTKSAALLLASAGAVLSCSNDVQTSQPDPEPVASSEQDLHGGEHARKKDPPPDPPASDCGATDTSPCLVTSALTGTRFSNLQRAINTVSDGDTLTVQGLCGAASVVSRTNLTIQGRMPTTGCGFNGPSPTLLRGEVQGLDVSSSTNISVRFLNLVHSSTDGLALVDSVTPLVTCVCTAFNHNDGIRLTGTTAVVVSQTLDEANATGIESNGTETVILSNNTVTANSGNGIFVANATNNNVSFNIVTNNGGDGILFQNVTQSLATGNTIRGNGDRLVNLIVCRNSQAFGNNVPPGCTGF